TFKADGPIIRDDILTLFAQAEADGKISGAERQDLIRICNPGSGFTMSDDVRELTLNVVQGNPANRQYQGHFLGNLHAGASAAKLEKLVDKWFFGEDLPAIDKHSHYEAISGSLFVDEARYMDAIQGQSGDCYFLSSLAELSVQDPSAIANMFISNGD